MLFQMKLLYAHHSISSLRKAFFYPLLSSLYSTKADPSIEPHFITKYLIKSFGFSSEKAISASKYLSHLDSESKPNSVLQFLKQTGLSDSDIHKAVSYYPRLLRVSVEKNLKPRTMELQEMGFSPSHITQLFYLSPTAFQCSTLQPKIKFLITFLGSIEKLLELLQKNSYLISTNIEKTIKPNLSFLHGHCGLSIHQIFKLIESAPRLITWNPTVFKNMVQRVNEMGIPYSSGQFKVALRVLSQRQSVLDAKFKNFRNIGWSEEEVFSMIRKQPTLLGLSEDNIRRTIDFLTSEVGLELPFLVHKPVLIMLSLDRRIIPRHYILRIIESKGILDEKKRFACAVRLTEKKFLEKFVRPYKDIIPGISEAYAAACAGKVPIMKSV